jgi:hypothetical protein
MPRNVPAQRQETSERRICCSTANRPGAPRECFNALARPVWLDKIRACFAENNLYLDKRGGLTAEKHRLKIMSQRDHNFKLDKNKKAPEILDREELIEEIKCASFFVRIATKSRRASAETWYIWLWLPYAVLPYRDGTALTAPQAALGAEAPAHFGDEEESDSDDCNPSSQAGPVRRPQEPEGGGVRVSPPRICSPKAGPQEALGGDDGQER